MSDKSNKVGYVGTDIPTQTQSSNTGIFSVNEITDLVRLKQFVTAGDLELIETQALNDDTYSTTAVEFNNLGSYNVHLLTFTNHKNNGYTPLGLQMKNVGASYSTGNSYAYAMQEFADNGTYTQTRSTGANSMRLGISSYQGSSGYAYIYNAIDSSKLTLCSSHSIQVRGNNVGANGMYGSSRFNSTTQVEGVRFVYDGTNSVGGVGVFSLYGLRGA